MKKKTKSPNHSSYMKKADELFMKPFRGCRCEICQSTKGTVAHHIVSKSRSKALRYDSRNIVILCPSHHMFSNEMAPHSTNTLAVERFIKWFKKTKKHQYAWIKEHERDQRKYNYKQAVENLQNGRVAWDS